MTETHAPFGSLLQAWRRRRRLSQLGLSLEAGVSQRHLSFVESGRSNPSREMVLHLAEALEVPPRERNALLVSAGYAPVLVDRGLDHPDLAAARHAVDAILKGHEPNPAIAVDRHWRLVAANAAVAPLLAGVSEDLLGPAANVLRLSLHPRGLADRIPNFRDWRAHVLARLYRQIDVSGDPVLAALLEELKSYPAPRKARPPTPAAALWGSHAFALELAAPDGTLLKLITTTTVFGTAVDISLCELAIESFFPADNETASALARMSGNAARE
ncbi:MAG TPA: helix-turn-helix transcriptional regulator [Methylomirabilota bacterium]|nr:helix-turn-helix transcriptional regulator [Methylomirabilota bacterium]